MKTYLPPKLELRDKVTGARLNETEKSAAFEQAVNYLCQRFIAKLPNPINYVSVQLDGQRLLFAVNGVALPSLSCEFSLFVKHYWDVEIPAPVSKAFLECKRALAKAKTSTEVWGIMVGNAVLRIGSTGSRVTNRNTSYEIIFQDLPTAFLAQELSKVVTLVNEDQRNKEWEVGYRLTCASEVGQFMDSIGKKELLLDTVATIKAFETIHDLARICDENNGRIPDTSLTSMQEIHLAA